MSFEKIIDAVWLCHIKMGERTTGSVYNILFDGEAPELVYVTTRNTTTTMKKLYAGSLGMSVAVMDKLKNIHHVSKIIIKYDRLDGKFDYFLTTVGQWELSPNHRADGLDMQRFINFADIKSGKLELADGVKILR